MQYSLVMGQIEFVISSKLMKPKEEGILRAGPQRYKTFWVFDIENLMENCLY